MAILAKLLGFHYMLESTETALRSILRLKALSRPGTLGKVHWEALGPTFIAALMMIVPTCPGIIRTVCKDRDHHLVCDKHRALIKEAVGLVLKHLDSDLSKWKTILHPASLKFIVLIQDQDLLGKVEALLPKTTLFKSQLRKALDVAILCGDWEMACYIKQKESIRRALTDSEFYKMVLAEAISLGDVVKVKEILDMDLAWNPLQTTLAGAKRALNKLNLPEEYSVDVTNVTETMEYLASTNLFKENSLNINSVSQINDISLLKCILRFPKISQRQERVHKMPHEAFKLVYLNKKISVVSICDEMIQSDWDPKHVDNVRFVLEERRDSDTYDYETFGATIVNRALIAGEVATGRTLIKEFGIKIPRIYDEWIKNPNLKTLPELVPFFLSDPTIDPSLKLLKVLALSGDADTVSLVLKDPRLVLPEKIRFRYDPAVPSKEDLFIIESTDFLSATMEDPRFDYTNMWETLFHFSKTKPLIFKVYAEYSRLSQEERDRARFLGACAEGDEIVVRSYIERGFDGEEAGKELRTTLDDGVTFKELRTTVDQGMYLASCHGFVRITSLLANLSTSNPKILNNAILVPLAAAGDVAGLLWALEVSGSEDLKGDHESLSLAVKLGHLEWVQTYISHPRVETISAWHTALVNWSIMNADMLKYLVGLDAGLDVGMRNFVLFDTLRSAHLVRPEMVDAVFELPGFSFREEPLGHILAEASAKGWLLLLKRFLPKSSKEKIVGAYERCLAKLGRVSMDQFETLEVIMSFMPAE
ncbi:hypothetical protein HDU97_001864 [Phlyctochytrium planicorne]|nr:hypothetical protein HDU97_001864 [Phlyctochytrium planicorne]